MNAAIEKTAMTVLAPPVGAPAETVSATTGVNVVAAAQEFLRDSGYSGLRHVSCTFHEGVLRLHGCVESYYLKQLAQTAVNQLRHVANIDNCLEVRRLEVWSTW